jgi:hypothetical protein
MFTDNFCRNNNKGWRIVLLTNVTFRLARYFTFIHVIMWSEVGWLTIADSP